MESTTTLNTAVALAKTLGVPTAAVERTSGHPAQVPSNAGIVVLLGDDAREPDMNVPSGTG